MAASSGLTQQSSLYSWSLDDFHNEPCANENNYCKNNGNKKDGMGSMNMEELLRNIYATEEQAEKITGNNDGGGGGGPQNLVVAPARQNSLTLPHFNKSVDEIWKEITASAPSATISASNSKHNETAAPPPPPRELTFGEMTLEDFLAKAGVVREDNSNSNSNSGSVVPNLAPENWQNFQFNAQPLCLQKQIQRPAPPVVFRKAKVPALQSNSTGGSVLEASSVVEASIESGATSSFDPFGNGVSFCRGKKRCGEALEDKAVDQRQRRMIKNRESAARSRERKQAYTVELESQLTQLKEENAQLTKQQEEEKKRRFKQLMETLIPVEEMQKPPQVLRRTRTALW